MTTIAFDGKKFASDSQVTGNYIFQTGFQKIKIIDKDDCKLVVAGCGELQVLCAFFEYIEGNIDDMPCDANTEFEALVYNVQTKELFLYQNRMIPIPAMPPMSIGSGSDFAMGAMLAGCDAHEAVEIASRLDPSTGGDTFFVDVELKPKASGQRTKKSTKSKKKS